MAAGPSAARLKVPLAPATLDWTRNDVFTVPGWTWARFVNTTGEPVFLYSVNDEPTMRKLGFFREELR